MSTSESLEYLLSERNKFEEKVQSKLEEFNLNYGRFKGINERSSNVFNKISDIENNLQDVLSLCLSEGDNYIGEYKVMLGDEKILLYNDGEALPPCGLLEILMEGEIMNTGYSMYDISESCFYRDNDIEKFSRIQDYANERGEDLSFYFGMNCWNNDNEVEVSDKTVYYSISDGTKIFLEEDDHRRIINLPTYSSRDFKCIMNNIEAIQKSVDESERMIDETLEFFLDLEDIIFEEFNSQLVADEL
jgi:hypothetical protein